MGFKLYQQTVLRRKKRKRLFYPQPEYDSYSDTDTGLYFIGPLGIWPWPLVNLILAIVEAIRIRSRMRYPTEPVQVFPRVASRRTEYIRDKEGRIIEKYEEISFE